MATRAEWEARVRKELEGKDPESLATTLPEGFAVPALAPDLDPAFPPPGIWPYARGSRPPPSRPHNMSRVDVGELARFRVEIEDDLTGGADALWLAGRGRPPTPDELVSALRHARADLVVGIDLGDDLAIARSLAEAVESRRDGVRAFVFAAPFSSGVPMERPFAIATHAWHAAGANGTLELAYAVATGVHSLRQLAKGGVDLATAAERVAFSVSVGRDVLVEIAKLRALRLVWAKVLAAAGVAAPPAWIHAASSEREMARRGPWNNLLRGTTAAFAAICGGADAVTVLPFDATKGGKPSREARRAARNTVTILREECAIAAVMDPGGGAPAVELVTDRLARSAWERFRRIEALGGMAACLLSGEIRRELEAAVVARGEPVVIGETEFTDPGDQPPGDAAVGGTPTSMTRGAR